MLLETNPYLLGVTFIVSLLHTLFDFLAFKNDVAYWRRKKSMKGMSVNTLAVQCVSQTIVLLYLFDNDTSYVILFSSVIGLVIEYWKLTKALRISISFTFPLPSITWDKGTTFSKSEESTRQHDSTAIAHLMPVLIPLLIGYSAYSLVQSSHKSFYSWILTSAVGFVYAFGFVMMTPQLFINYKMKSVAHMPWKAMVLHNFLIIFISFNFPPLIRYT